MAHDLNYVLTVPIGTEQKELLQQQATQDGRTFTGYCRYLLYTALRDKGLVNDDFDVVQPALTPAAVSPEKKQ